MKYIESKSNPIIKEAASIIAGKLSYAMLEGPKLLKEAIRSEASVKFALTSDPELDFPKTIENKVYLVPHKIIASLSKLQTPSNIISFIEYPKFPAIEQVLHKPGITVVLDRLQDPGNIGTIIRTSEAMGASSVVLLKGSVSKYNYKIIRAAMGSAFRLPIYEGLSVQDVFDLFKSSNTIGLCADMQGEDITSFEFPEKCGIFMGQEGQGLSEYIQQHCEYRISIPMQGLTESLNVASSASIILYAHMAYKRIKRNV